MSGSIGGKRILREEVFDTLISYEENILKKFPGYERYEITGSYNTGLKKDHGDIDLVVYIKGEDISLIKKQFKAYLDSLNNNLTRPFEWGKRVGEKSQLFGQIVTCGYPIYNREQDYVQIDNVIVNSPEKLDFQTNFLNLSANKQAILMGLTRVYSQYNEEFIRELGVEMKKEFDYEFVLSPQGITFRELKLVDYKEVSRKILWKSYDWSNLNKLLYNINTQDSYEDILKHISFLDERSRRRIVGLVKSVIRIGIGEIGTEKGNEKERSLKLIDSILK